MKKVYFKNKHDELDYIEQQKQVAEQKKTNFVLWINTIFNIIQGIASLIIAYWMIKH